MRAISNFVLKVGQLQLPLACYKSVDDTESIHASEVTKINGKAYRVQRKPYVVLEDGSEQDIDSTQILKAYEKDDGSTAIFTKAEQDQLLKRGSSKEWVAQAVVSRDKFHELSFQKDGLVAFPELDKKKELLNKKNLKFFAMLKAGLKDGVIVTQILYRNVEYPVAISNFQDKLLVRFVHYGNEVRSLDMGVALPSLTAEEQAQAEAFVKQFQKDVDPHSFENKTEDMVLKLINSRGAEAEVDAEVQLDTTIDNPFAVVKEA